MTLRKLLWLCLFTVGWAAMSACVFADDLDPAVLEKRRRSHIEIRIPGAADPDLKKWLAERVRQARQSDLEKLAAEIINNPKRFGINPTDLKGLEGVDLNDPQLQEAIRKIIEGQTKKNPGFKLSPEELKRLEEAAKNLRPPSSPPPSTNPPTQPPATPPTTPPTTPPENPPSTNLPTSDPELEREQAEMVQRLRNWFGRMESARGPWQESPALRRALRDLGRLGLNRDGRLPQPGNGDSLDAQLARFNRNMRNMDDWWRSNRQAFRNLEMPSLPRLDLSGMRWSAPNLPSLGGASRTGLPDASGGGGLWEVLAVLAGGIILVALLWKLWHWQLGGALAPGGSSWKLGPWPVNPAQVASRVELIRAFEHLSLLCLGLPARCFNHRQIASRLGESPERQHAARELANLYEHARYAPAAEPLTEVALQRARHDLCLLAGT